MFNVHPVICIASVSRNQLFMCFSSTSLKSECFQMLLSTFFSSKLPNNTAKQDTRGYSSKALCFSLFNHFTITGHIKNNSILRHLSDPIRRETATSTCMTSK